jgi:hypothetical protein
MPPVGVVPRLNSSVLSLEVVSPALRFSVP